MAQFPLDQDFDFRNHSDQNKKDIVDFYDLNGYCIGKVMDNKACRKAVQDLWNSVILEYPHTLLPVVYDASGNIIDTRNPACCDALYLALTSPIRAKVRYEMAQRFPPGVDFGRPMSGESFHNDTINGFRQDVNIYNTACLILRWPGLKVTIDGSIIRLPGYGSDEFLHIDKNGPQGIAERAALGPQYELQGKLVLTPGQTLQIVPGSHNVDVHEQLKIHFPKVKKGAAKFSIAKDNDPLKMWDKITTIKLKPKQNVF